MIALVIIGWLTSVKNNKKNINNINKSEHKNYVSGFVLFFMR